jgi:excisionase family DNA binding protein
MEKILNDQQEELSNLVKVFSELSDSAQKAQQVVSEMLNDKLNNEKGFLDVIGAANYLGVSVNTIYSYTSKNTLPYYKTGKNIYFAPADLKEFVLNPQNRVSSKNEIKEQAANAVYLSEKPINQLIKNKRINKINGEKIHEKRRISN